MSLSDFNPRVGNFQQSDFQKSEAQQSAVQQRAVQQSVRDAFEHSPIHGLRELEVEQNGSSILISGKVNSFYQKQLAQEVVRHINPRVQIVNTIVVD